MNELIAANWPIILVALFIGIAVAWFVFFATRKAKVEIDTSDVLDAGKGPAARNQALIDAPAAAAGSTDPQPEPRAQQIAEVAPGKVSAAANLNVAAHASAEADAEAGAPGSAREAMQEMHDTAAETRPAQDDSALDDEIDDLTRIKGVGPKLRDLLNSLGVTSFEQIAGWSAEDITRIDAQLGRFEGRITRDSWVEQARLLSAGDTAAYEGQFGKL